MGAIEEIDRQIRRLTGEAVQSRPFLCSGSPVGCDVVVVGINPGTDTPFWPYWNTKTGYNKDAWLAEYKLRNGRLKPTRDRLEILCRALSPLRCLELNLYHHFSQSEAALPKMHRDTALFDFMLRTVQPRVLLVHGAKPIKHLGRLLGIRFTKDSFATTTYHGSSIDVFAAERHFAYVSRDYVGSVGAILKARVLEMKAQQIAPADA